MARQSPPKASRDYDEDISKDDGSLSVVQAILQAKLEAADAKIDRLAKNQSNRDAYLGRQDWSHKLDGQSTEFLPKVPVSVEQMSAFIKRGLINSGEWYSIKPNAKLGRLIYGPQMVALLDVFLNNLWAPNGQSTDIYTVISDGVKVGMLESLMIFKVHGGMVNRRKFSFERGTTLDVQSGSVSQDSRLVSDVVKEWRLRVDLVRSEDYFPDPTGNGLYEIHSVERDLHDVIAMADDGVYDQDAVDQLINEDFPQDLDEKRTDKARNQNEAPPPAFRKRVTLTEFWGTLLNSDGTVAHENIVACVANGRFLIRPPEPNPFWHQESPFVAVPLIRVPWSVWHKALYDDASALNYAINEMFNLILDGGMAAVWGVRQIRLDDLEDPGQVSGGIQQGATLAVKSTLAHNAKVLEQVTEGDVPQDAMAVFEFLNREFTQAALTNELKLGSLPAKRVLATEVTEASQSQAITLEGILGDVENACERVISKAWMVMLQNADDVPEDTITDTVDMRTALLVMRATPEERFALFHGNTKFKVSGLTATANKAKEFQKIMAILQAVVANPLLMQAFARRYSAAKVLNKMYQTMNVNPNDLEKDQEELAKTEQDIQEAFQIAQALGLTKGPLGGQEAPTGTSGEPGMPSQTPAQPALPAQVSQTANPMTGMVPNG